MEALKQNTIECRMYASDYVISSCDICTNAGLLSTEQLKINCNKIWVTKCYNFHIRNAFENVYSMAAIYFTSASVWLYQYNEPWEYKYQFCSAETAVDNQYCP